MRIVYSYLLIECISYLAPSLLHRLQLPNYSSTSSCMIFLLGACHFSGSRIDFSGKFRDLKILRFVGWVNLWTRELCQRSFN